MRVLVCGSRTFEDEFVVDAALTGVCMESDSYAFDNFVIVEGGARGADHLAATWAAANPGVRVEEYPADWAKHGKAAGPIRNELMLANAQPIDLVLAFVDKPLVESKGTYDMVRRAKRCHIPTYVVQRV